MRQLLPSKVASAADSAKWCIKQSGLSPSRMSAWADQNVIQLLNLESNSVTKRVAEIVEMCRRIGELTERIRLSSASAIKALFIERNEILTDLNARLAKFKWHPVVRAYMGADTHFSVSYEVPTSDDAAFENRAIQWVMDHIDAVHRIRRCRRLQCQKWFFAVTDHQKYCEDNCRKRDAAQGESFKEKRRLYMRRYRKDEKVRESRAQKPDRGR
jgi:hypothetical protein